MSKTFVRYCRNRVLIDTLFLDKLLLVDLIVFVFCVLYVTSLISLPTDPQAQVPLLKTALLVVI